MRSDGTARCNPIGVPRHQLRGFCQRKWSSPSGGYGHSSDGCGHPSISSPQHLVLFLSGFSDGLTGPQAAIFPALTCLCGRSDVVAFPIQVKGARMAWADGRDRSLQEGFGGGACPMPFPNEDRGVRKLCRSGATSACPVDPQRVPRRRQSDPRRYDESRPAPKPGCVADRRNRPLPRHVEDVPGSPAEPARPMAAAPATVAPDGEAPPYGPESARHRSGFGPFP